MPAPDPLVARVFEMQLRRHRDGARNELKNAQGKVQSLAQDLDEGSKESIVIALGTAKNLARDLADLIAHLSALTTLQDVEFLVADAGEGKPDA